MSVRERKLKQKQDRAKRNALVPDSVREGLKEGKHYKNYTSNQAIRRRNPNARKIKSGKIVTFWETDSKPISEPVDSNTKV